jgi:UDP-glucose-4-epimerase GalE
MENTTEHQFPNPNIKSISRSVLVTGGAGYVGSHCCKFLAKNGYIPVVIDRNLKNKPIEFGPSFEINLPTNIEALDDIIKRYNIDSCIHFAGSASVAESVADPSQYYKNNVIMTIALLDKLIANNIKTFVYSSSAATYGDPGLTMCQENDFVNPINSYGATKLMMERICKDYNIAYGLSSVGLRYFNAAGADPDADVGELREQETHIIPLAIEAGRQNKTFKLFGNEYGTDDGTCVRDYVHVMDLANAHVKALNYASNNNCSEIINLGSGEPVSNKQLLDTIQKHIGKMDIKIEPNRPGDPAYLVADISKAKKILNWGPTQSSIDNVVGTALKWYNKVHKKEIQ